MLYAVLYPVVCDVVCAVIWAVLCMQPGKGRGQSQHLFATDAVISRLLPTVTFGLFSEEGKLGRQLLFLVITRSAYPGPWSALRARGPQLRQTSTPVDGRPVRPQAGPGAGGLGGLASSNRSAVVVLHGDLLISHILSHARTDRSAAAYRG